jgi:hypothetical protein
VSNYAPTRTTYDTVDRRWLPDMLKAETHGITMDADLFIASADFAAGDVVPSGTQVTPAGGPYTGPVDEVVVITRTATGGTVDITLDGETNAAVSIVAATTAAQVKAALEALSNVNVGDVTVTGAAGGPFTVTFVAGPYSGANAPDLVIDDTNATGGTVEAAITAGAAAAAGVDGYLLNDQKLTAGEQYHVALVHAGTVRRSLLPDTHNTDGEADLPAVVHL